MKSIPIWTAVFLTLGIGGMRADDWPEFRGKGRRGAWNETGILDKFPESALKVLWRTPIKGGFAGPSVAGGRVFVTDFSRLVGGRGIERALALEEKTGKILWSREWETIYRGFAYDYGPRATPTVDGDRVYVVGASGMLVCLNVKTGEVLWRRDYGKDFGADVGQWGHSSAPVVHENLIIALVGGQPDALMVAFDKMTGGEVWRALPTKTEQGVGQPIIITAAGVGQLIIFQPWGISSLNPATGKVYWEVPTRLVPVQARLRLGV